MMMDTDVVVYYLKWALIIYHHLQESRSMAPSGCFSIPLIIE